MSRFPRRHGVRVVLVAEVDEPFFVLVNHRGLRSAVGAILALKFLMDKAVTMALMGIAPSFHLKPPYLGTVTLRTLHHSTVGVK